MHVSNKQILSPAVNLETPLKDGASNILNAHREYHLIWPEDQTKRKEEVL